MVCEMSAHAHSIVQCFDECLGDNVDRFIFWA